MDNYRDLYDAQERVLAKIIADPSKAIGQWYVYPDRLPTRRFSGFQNRDQESFLRGAFVIGQNVMFGGDSLPTLRSGYEVIGTEAVNATPVTRAWVFETRNGAQFELKAYDTFIDYYLRGTSTAFARLKGGFTANLEFGYANIGETGGDFHSFFCNGVDAWFQFNGAYANIASTTINTIVLDNTVALSGFYSAAGFVIINGTAYEYTGTSGSTLTGVTTDPRGEANGSLVVQQPRAVSFTNGPAVSKVMMAHDGRIHARSDLKKSVWNYSKLDNPDDWTTGALDGDAGTKDIEFSGPITAFSKLNNAAICLKERLLKLLFFNQVGDRVDSPYYQTLVPADDKSTTLGAINQRSTFSTPLGLVFVTPDKRMVLLTGVTDNNQPQYVFLSDTIQPLFTAGDHTGASGICVDNIVWYAFKSSADVSSPDTVIRGDLTRQSYNTNGQVIPIQWDAPFVGWNVNDWTAVFNSDESRNEVHFHSSLNSNTYRVIDTKTDATNSFTGIIRTWAENFDFPGLRKRLDYAYVEVQMNSNTELLCTILYDEDGVTQQTEFNLSGDDTANEFGITVYNPFGASRFGSQKFGSNDTLPRMAVYRFILELDPNIYFYNLSMQFGVDEQNNDFKVIRYGWRIAEIEQALPLTLLKTSSN